MEDIISLMVEVLVGTFKLTEKLIREKNIEITKRFDEEKTFELYQELNKKTDRTKQKDRNSR